MIGHSIKRQEIFQGRMRSLVYSLLSKTSRAREKGQPISGNSSLAGDQYLSPISGAESLHSGGSFSLTYHAAEKLTEGHFTTGQVGEQWEAAGHGDHEERIGGNGSSAAMNSNPVKRISDWGSPRIPLRSGSPHAI